MWRLRLWCWGRCRTSLRPVPPGRLTALAERKSGARSSDASPAVISDEHPRAGAWRRALSVLMVLVVALSGGLAFVSSSRADVVINELRGSGATADDDYVELFNRGSAPVNMFGWRLDARAGDDSAAGSVTLPAQTIAPRGKLLVTAAGYSLGALATSDDALTGGLLGGEVPAGGSVALIDAANATQDSVRFAPATTYGEGGPVGSFSSGGQYAFVRKANRTGIGDAYGL